METLRKVTSSVDRYCIDTLNGRTNITGIGSNCESIPVPIYRYNLAIHRFSHLSLHLSCSTRLVILFRIWRHREGKKRNAFENRSQTKSEPCAYAIYAFGVAGQGLCVLSVIAGLFVGQFPFREFVPLCVWGFCRTKERSGFVRIGNDDRLAHASGSEHSYRVHSKHASRHTHMEPRCVHLKYYTTVQCVLAIQNQK